MSSSNHVYVRCPIHTTKQYNSKTIKPNQYKLRLPRYFTFTYQVITMHFTPSFRSMVWEQHTFEDLLTNPTLLDKVSKETWGLIQFSKSLSSIQLWQISASLLGQQIANKEWGTTLSGAEIHHSVFLFSTLPLETGAECHYWVATVWCHPNQSRISIWTAYKMLESHNMSEELLVVLACAYEDVKYSPHLFPGIVAVAIADDAKWDLYAKALRNITAWQLLSDKDGKVICPKELVGHNHLNSLACQVKFYGRPSPMASSLP